MIPKPGGKSHCMKLSKRFIILIWKLLYWAASLGQFCDITSSRRPKQGERVWNPSPLFWLCLLWQPKYIVFALLLCLLSPYCWITLSSLNHFFMSSFVNFPFIHSKRLFPPRGGITKAITEPHAVICRACSLGNMKFQRWVGQRVPHKIITTVQWGCFT